MNLRLVLSAAILLPVFATRTVTPLSAQTPDVTGENGLTFAFRGVPLSIALEEYSRISGQSIAYESSLVGDRLTYCVIERATPSASLSCILRGTGLDYFTLSSGTIVLAGSAEQSPLYGYLRGVVIDGASGEPLAQASVRIEGSRVGTATNAGGGFALPPMLAGSYGIRVSHVGYHSWQGIVTVGAGSNLPTPVRLVRRSIPIRPIVVDGTTNRLLSQQLGAPRAELDEADPVGDADVFARAAGLSGVRINDAAADLLADGAEAGEMRLYLDGAPVFLPQQGIGIIGPFSAFALDRLTVHRAGYGVVPGSLVAGVVEAEHALHNPWSHLQVDWGGINTRLKLGSPSSRSGLTFAVAARVGSWDVYSPSRLADVLAAWSSADPFLIVAPLGLYEYATDSFVTDTLGLRANVRPIVNYSDIHAAVEYKPSPLRTLNASFYLGNHGLSGGRRAERGVSLANDPPQGSFSAADEYDWQNALAQIRYTTVIGQRTLATAQLYGSSFRMEHAFDLVDNLNLPVFAESLDYPAAYGDIGLPVRDENRMNEIGATFSLDHSRGSHQLVGGLEAALRASSIRIRAHSIAPDHQAETTSVRDAIQIDADRSSADVDSGTLAAWIEDRFQIGRNVNLTGGMRTTYVGRRNTVYAEPRLSATFDTESLSGRRFSGRVAGGLYRQFVTQLDLSALNAGSLLPSVRIWLPTDGSLRPSRAWHVAASASVSPEPGWTFTANAFGRYFDDVWAYNYAGAGLAGGAGQQSDFLTSVEGRTLGADIEIARTAERVAVSVQYGFVLTERSSPELFGGRVVSSPGVDPHHLRAEVTASPVRPLTVRATWRSGWDRRWAYTRAYYDYFGHDESLRLHEGYDFGRPDDHVLPAMHQLDVGMAVSRGIGPIVLQLRADITNVLRRENVAGYRLIHDGETLVPAARPLMPRLVMFSAQLSWRLK